MGKPGKKFELGAPYITKGGLCYFWPSLADKKLFLERIIEVDSFILENVKKYMKEVGRHDLSHYPYKSIGDEKITVNIGRECECFAVDGSSSTGMISPHSLEKITGSIIAFNTASDILEFLDEKTSAPRIIVNGNVYALKYDLPDDNKILPFEKYPEAYSKENMQENFNIADLGRITEIVEQKDRQIIFSTKGRIEIRNGVCFSNSFLMADIPGATFVIKTLLWPYNHS